MTKANCLATSTTRTEAHADRKAFVTLRFVGDGLDPDQISAILPVRPTRAHRKGEEFFAGPHAGKLPGRTGLWFLATDKLVPSDDLQEHLAFVEQLFYPDAGEDSGIRRLHDILERTHSRTRVTCFWRGGPSRLLKKGRLRVGWRFGEDFCGLPRRVGGWCATSVASIGAPHA
ncbi:MAG: DUF4279 domain-containing protein, partial [Stellaceae bacterium]